MRMSDSKLTYLGPLPKFLSGADGKKTLLQRIPVALMIVVGLPTLIAAVYFLLIASPRYVSEARFIVRAPAKEQPSSLGVALQGVGIASTQTDAFAVHEYIESPNALREMSRTLDLRRIYSQSATDPFSRVPKPWQSGSFDEFHEGLKGYFTVGYDATTGISTLRVEAFKPEDAQAVAQQLLIGGERLINHLNERANEDAVSQAELTVEKARNRLVVIQGELTAFRDREQFFDPEQTATVSTELISKLAVELATLRAERALVADQTPQSPALPTLDGRIRALNAQLEIERGRIAGDQDSLVRKAGAYEALILNRELASRAVAAASASLEAAQIDARRQKLYLDRVVDPTRPTDPSQPRRLLSILAVFATCLLIYAGGWLVWAGLRESQHHS